ncbi:MAG: GntR family transcriptional regulator [Peptococcaceae bacterium]
MMHEETIDKNSVIPIYYQLAKLFEGRIRRGELKPGEAMPSETDIAAEFGISRMTVRRAISELVTAGMVYAQQGKGTFVAIPKLNNIVFELDNFTEEIKERGLQCKTRLLEAKIVRATDTLKILFRTDDESTKFLYFRTVLSAENEQLVYEKKYTIYTKNKPILESEIKDPTLPGLIEANSGYLPVSSEKVLYAAVSTQEEAEILGIGLNAPLFVIEQTIFDPDLKPVGWSKSMYRGDRYKLTAYDGWYEKSKETGGFPIER